MLKELQSGELLNHLPEFTSVAKSDGETQRTDAAKGTETALGNLLDTLETSGVMDGVADWFQNMTDGTSPLVASPLSGERNHKSRQKGATRKKGTHYVETRDEDYAAFHTKNLRTLPWERLKTRRPQADGVYATKKRKAFTLAERPPSDTFASKSTQTNEVVLYCLPSPSDLCISGTLQDGPDPPRYRVRGNVPQRIPSLEAFLLQKHFQRLSQLQPRRQTRHSSRLNENMNPDVELKERFFPSTVLWFASNESEIAERFQKFVLRRHPIAASLLGMRNSSSFKCETASSDEHTEHLDRPYTFPCNIETTYFNTTSDALQACERTSLSEQAANVNSPPCSAQGVVWAIVDFRTFNNETGKYDYAIYMNHTRLPPSTLKKTPEGITDSFKAMSSAPWDTDDMEMFLPVLGSNAPFTKYLTSGFLVLQSLLDEFVCDEQTQYQRKEDVEGSSPFSTKPILVRFPDPPKLLFDFLSQIGPHLPLTLIFGFTYFVSHLTQALVEEKESRTREVLWIMGLRRTSYYASWAIAYAFSSAISSGLLSTALSRTLLSQTSFFVLFAVLFLFCFSLIGFSALLSTLFERAQLAALVTPLIFTLSTLPVSLMLPTSQDEETIQLLVAYTNPFYWIQIVCKYVLHFLRISPSSDPLPNFSVLLALPFSSTSFTLWMRQMVKRESSGRGISVLEVLTGASPNWFYQSCWLLLLSIIFSAFLALFLDQVLPNTYGIQKPFFEVVKDFTSNFYNSLFHLVNLWKATIPVKTTTWSKAKRCTNKPTVPRSDASTTIHLQHLRKTFPDTLPPPPQQRAMLSNAHISENNRLETANDRTANDQTSNYETSNYQTAKYQTANYQAANSQLAHSSSVTLAVDDLCLALPSHSITVLLGHNGAGKSTVLHMLTGMLRPSSGDIQIFGQSLTQQCERLRDAGTMGFCPQHNLLWSGLTVVQHLYFVSALKQSIRCGDKETDFLGNASTEIEHEVNEMMRKLNLLDKAHFLPSQLSGGQKRKLSISMALLGNSPLVVLDEPTAGIDVASRRALWDLLSEYVARKTGNGQKDGNCISDLSRPRTLLISTHYLDEADALGTQIAILHKARLRCVGTPLELKQRYGAGYILSLSMFSRSVSPPDPTNISSQESKSSRESNAENNKNFRTRAELYSLISQHVPDTRILVDREAEIQISLPSTESETLAALFEALEDPTVRTQYGIESMGIQHATLEDVFKYVSSEREMTLPLKPKEFKTMEHDPNQEPFSRTNSIKELQNTNLRMNADTTRHADQTRHTTNVQSLPPPCFHQTRYRLLLSQVKGILSQRLSVTLRDRRYLLSATLLPVALLFMILWMHTRASEVAAPTPLEISPEGALPSCAMLYSKTQWGWSFFGDKQGFRVLISTPHNSSETKKC